MRQCVLCKVVSVILKVGLPHFQNDDKEIRGHQIRVFVILFESERNG